MPAVEISAGDPASGAELFASPPQGCIACHTIDGVSAGPVGPDLTTIGADVTVRLAGGTYDGEATDVSSYLLESLVAPDAFIAPECPIGDCSSGSMPGNLAETLTPQELADLVAYLAGLG